MNRQSVESTSLSDLETDRKGSHSWHSRPVLFFWIMYKIYEYSYSICMEQCMVIYQYRYSCSSTTVWFGDVGVCLQQ